MKYFNKILIANRGEIAIRIINTCKKMGILTVAVYSDADKNALFVQTADEAIGIGGHQPAESYLVANLIIAAAIKTNADAIHPGYGFLSENAAFAQLCIDNNICFIGPNPKAINAMGLKIEAKEIAIASGVPIVPGYLGKNQNIKELTTQAIQIGFPVLLKASAGGGGKGMRIVRTEAELKNNIEAAKREAMAAFGNDTLLIEKYFDSVKHIEIQIMGDKYGNVIHCFERECSIQRRYQKIIEESPSPALSELIRAEMGAAAVNIAKAISYDNAGTVEFILTPNNEFYFLEVNTRLQVEHPVTELVTGLDLVQLQIQSAMGMPLLIQQNQVVQNGHAIECRLYAENAANNYMPQTGTIYYYNEMQINNIRYDSGVKTNSVVDIYYDPMIAKIIAHAPTRAAAIQKIKYALQNLTILGLTTNQEFLIQILQNKHFIHAEFDTHFLQNKFTFNANLPENTINYFAIASILFMYHARKKNTNVLPQLPSAWRNNFFAPQQQNLTIDGKTQLYKYTINNELFNIEINDKSFIAELIFCNEHQINVIINAHRLQFSIAQNGNTLFAHNPVYGTVNVQIEPRFSASYSEEVKGNYRANIPAEVVKVLVQQGSSVNSGQPLIVLSSMKMETTIEAHSKGIVKEVYVSEKNFVNAETLLLKIEED